MTPRHHPRSQTLAHFQAGDLSPGAALGVAAHVEACPACWTAVGGRPSEAGEGGAAADRPAAEPISRALALMPGARPDRWRWAGAGLALAHVRGAAGLGERVYLIRGRPGARLAPHGHAGAEYVTVLQGRFSESGEVFEAGDFCEHEGADCVHRLRVIGQQICICLVATEAPLKLSGLARLVQPWLGV